MTGAGILGAKWAGVQKRRRTTFGSVLRKITPLAGIDRRALAVFSDYRTVHHNPFSFSMVARDEGTACV